MRIKIEEEYHGHRWVLYRWVPTLEWFYPNKYGAWMYEGCEYSENIYKTNSSDGPIFKITKEEACRKIKEKYETKSEIFEV